LPDPIVALAPSPPATERPRFASGAELLQHVLDAGARSWISPTDALADVLVLVYDDWLVAGARWRATGLPADYRVYDALTGRLMACLSDLGLDPVSRSRLGLAEVQALSGLADLRAQRARKAGRVSATGPVPSH
jgi:hypothetical protein